MSSSKDELLLRLVPTPKAVQIVKELRPDVFLVSFKLESGIPEKDLIQKAEQSLVSSGSDIVIANLQEQTGPETHKAFFIGMEGIIGHAEGKQEIASALISIVAKALQ
jgi:phosphopantothenoylcysteine decarboxylase/phosphopantothenate--cysteine ligase